MSARRVTPGYRSEILADRICRHIEEHYHIPGERIDQFRRAPSAGSLERLLFFRSDPMIDEFRAALMRLEAGTYGRCLRCRAAIAEDQVEGIPLSRICQECDQDLSPGKRARPGHASRRRLRDAKPARARPTAGPGD